MGGQTAAGVESLSSYYYICVLILLYTCPHTTCFRILGADASEGTAAGVESEFEKEEDERRQLDADVQLTAQERKDLYEATMKAIEAKVGCACTYFFCT